MAADHVSENALQSNFDILKFSKKLGGINPTNSRAYSSSLEPRSDVYCFTLNFNISKLGYWDVCYLRAIILFHRFQYDIGIRQNAQRKFHHSLH